MKVRLRVLHGKLLDKEGHGKGMVVKIPGPRFVIGSAADCSMCCKSTSVSPYHCEIFVGQRHVSIRSLSKEAGTRVNGEPVERERILRAGDQLQIGRLEFEVLIETPASAADVLDNRQDGADETGKDWSDMLAEADAKDRAFRLQHPELRELHLESANSENAAAEDRAAGNRKDGKKKDEPEKKDKKLPGKLPLPPVRQTEDSTEAAQEALRRMFRP
jgi:predicted component of type VI protein secretion system